VIADGVAVGRIMKALTAPVGSPWFGTWAYGFHRKRNPTHVGAELRARCSGENVFDLHLCHSPLWASIRGNDDRHQAEIACLAFARCVVFRGETGDRCRVTRDQKRAPRVAININQRENGPIEISPTHSDAGGWQTRLKDALGTSSRAFVDVELRRLLTVFRDTSGRVDPTAVDAALAMIDGLKPQNEIEAMLAVQIAVTHGLAMKFSAPSLQRQD